MCSALQVYFVATVCRAEWLTLALTQAGRPCFKCSFSCNFMHMMQMSLQLVKKRSFVYTLLTNYLSSLETQEMVKFAHM